MRLCLEIIVKYSLSAKNVTGEMWRTISHSTSHNWLELKAKNTMNTALSFGRNTASNTSISCGVFRDKNLSLFQTWLCCHHQSIKATFCQSDTDLFYAIYSQICATHVVSNTAPCKNIHNPTNLHILSHCNCKRQEVKQSKAK